MPTDQTQAQILDTLRSLEKSRRRWRALAGSIMMIGVGLGVLAATGVVQPSSVVQTRRLEVVNDQGQVMLSLGSDADGGTMFLFNADRSEAIESFADEQGRGVFRVNGSDGTDRLILTSNDQGGETTLTDTQANVIARTDASEATHRAFTVAAGTPQAATLTADAAGGRLLLRDDSGDERVSIGVTPTRSGQLSIFNQGGLSVFDAYADTEDRGVVLIADELGRRRVTLQVDADGGALFLLNSREQAIVEAYANQAGDGLLLVSNRLRHPRVSIGSDPSGGGVIHQFDRAGNPESPSSTARIDPR